MTTSFLGLRRYLRQRRLEMPLEMASVWLTVGSLMIAALLFVCWLLPRPNAEYSITQVPFQVSSPTTCKHLVMAGATKGAGQAAASSVGRSRQQGARGTSRRHRVGGT